MGYAPVHAFLLWCLLCHSNHLWITGDEPQSFSSSTALSHLYRIKGILKRVLFFAPVIRLYKAKLFFHLPTVPCAMKLTYFLMHELVDDYQNSSVLWGLVISVEAASRLELGFQVQNEFSGL